MSAVLTPQTRFSGLAEGYDRFRPEYPAALWQLAVEACGLDVPKRAIDVGAGTGIATRQLAAALPAEWHVVGVEPNADMRAQAMHHDSPDSRIGYVDQQAEDLRFDRGSAGLVTVAQAIHWFDRPAFYARVGETLAPGGALVVLYNDRDVDGAGLLGTFEALMEREIPGYDRNYRRGPPDAQDEELAALAWAGDVRSHRSAWERRMPPADFAGLMLSRSKLKPYSEKIGRAAAARRLVELADGHRGRDGMVGVGYTARIHIATRR